MSQSPLSASRTISKSAAASPSLAASRMIAQPPMLTMPDGLGSSLPAPLSASIAPSPLSRFHSHIVPKLKDAYAGSGIDPNSDVLPPGPPTGAASGSGEILGDMMRHSSIIVVDMQRETDPSAALLSNNDDTDNDDDDDDDDDGDIPSNSPTQLPHLAPAPVILPHSMPPPREALGSAKPLPVPPPGSARRRAGFMQFLYGGGGEDGVNENQQQNNIDDQLQSNMTVDEYREYLKQQAAGGAVSRSRRNSNSFKMANESKEQTMPLSASVLRPSSAMPLSATGHGASMTYPFRPASAMPRESIAAAGNINVAPVTPGLNLTIADLRPTRPQRPRSAAEVMRSATIYDTRFRRDAQNTTAEEHALAVSKLPPEEIIKEMHNALHEKRVAEVEAREARVDREIEQLENLRANREAQIALLLQLENEVETIDSHFDKRDFTKSLQAKGLNLITARANATRELNHELRGVQGWLEGRSMDSMVDEMTLISRVESQGAETELVRSDAEKALNSLITKLSIPQPVRLELMAKLQSTTAQAVLDREELIQMLKRNLWKARYYLKDAVNSYEKELGDHEATIQKQEKMIAALKKHEVENKELLYKTASQAQEVLALKASLGDLRTELTESKTVADKARDYLEKMNANEQLLRDARDRAQLQTNQITAQYTSQLHANNKLHVELKEMKEQQAKFMKGLKLQEAQLSAVNEMFRSRRELLSKLKAQKAAEEEAARAREEAAAKRKATLAAMGLSEADQTFLTQDTSQQEEEEMKKAEAESHTQKVVTPAHLLLHHISLNKKLYRLLQLHPDNANKRPDMMIELKQWIITAERQLQQLMTNSVIMHNNKRGSANSAQLEWLRLVEEQRRKFRFMHESELYKDENEQERQERLEMEETENAELLRILDEDQARSSDESESDHDDDDEDADNTDAELAELYAQSDQPLTEEQRAARLRRALERAGMTEAEARADRRAERAELRAEKRARRKALKEKLAKENQHRIDEAAHALAEEQALSRGFSNVEEMERKDRELAELVTIASPNKKKPKQPEPVPRYMSPTGKRKRRIEKEAAKKIGIRRPPSTAPNAGRKLFGISISGNASAEEKSRAASPIHASSSASATTTIPAAKGSPRAKTRGSPKMGKRSVASGSGKTATKQRSVTKTTAVAAGSVSMEGQKEGSVSFSEGEHTATEGDEGDYLADGTVTDTATDLGTDGNMTDGTEASDIVPGAATSVPSSPTSRRKKKSKQRRGHADDEVGEADNANPFLPAAYRKLAKSAAPTYGTLLPSWPGDKFFTAPNSAEEAAQRKKEFEALVAQAAKLQFEVWRRETEAQIAATKRHVYTQCPEPLVSLDELHLLESFFDVPSIEGRNTLDDSVQAVGSPRSSGAASPTNNVAESLHRTIGVQAGIPPAYSNVEFYRWFLDQILHDVKSGVRKPVPVPALYSLYAYLGHDKVENMESATFSAINLLTPFQVVERPLNEMKRRRRKKKGKFANYVFRPPAILPGEDEETYRARVEAASAQEAMEMAQAEAAAAKAAASSPSAAAAAQADDEFEEVGTDEGGSDDMTDEEMDRITEIGRSSFGTDPISEAVDEGDRVMVPYHPLGMKSTDRILIADPGHLRAKSVAEEIQKQQAAGSGHRSRPSTVLTAADAADMPPSDDALASFLDEINSMPDPISSNAGALLDELGMDSNGQPLTEEEARRRIELYEKQRQAEMEAIVALVQRIEAKRIAKAEALARKAKREYLKSGPRIVEEGPNDGAAEQEDYTRRDPMAMPLATKAYEPPDGTVIHRGDPNNISPEWRLPIRAVSSHFMADASLTRQFHSSEIMPDSLNYSSGLVLDSGARSMLLRQQLSSSSAAADAIAAGEQWSTLESTASPPSAATARNLGSPRAAQHFSIHVPPLNKVPLQMGAPMFQLPFDATVQAEVLRQKREEASVAGSDISAHSPTKDIIASALAAPLSVNDHAWLSSIRARLWQQQEILLKKKKQLLRAMMGPARERLAQDLHEELVGDKEAQAAALKAQHQKGSKGKKSGYQFKTAYSQMHVAQRAGMAPPAHPMSAAYQAAAKAFGRLELFAKLRAAENESKAKPAVADSKSNSDADPVKDEPSTTVSAGKPPSAAPYSLLEKLRAQDAELRAAALELEARMEREEARDRIAPLPNLSRPGSAAGHHPSTSSGSAKNVTVKIPTIPVVPTGTLAVDRLGESSVAHNDGEKVLYASQNRSSTFASSGASDEDEYISVTTAQGNVVLIPNPNHPSNRSEIDANRSSVPFISSTPAGSIATHPTPPAPMPVPPHRPASKATFQMHQRIHRRA